MSNPATWEGWAIVLARRLRDVLEELQTANMCGACEDAHPTLFDSESGAQRRLDQFNTWKAGKK